MANKITSIQRTAIANSMVCHNRHVIHGPQGLVWTSTKVPYVAPVVNPFVGW